MRSQRDPFGMGVKLQTSLGLAATLTLVLISELLPVSGLTLVAVALLTLASAIGGIRLPLFLRVFTTGATIYLGYLMCLLGRTTGPHFTVNTALAASFIFGAFVTLPMLALLRIWSGHLRVVIVASLFPISLAIASAVAAFEEHEFIQQHREGVGPTPRRTVSHHWLAYDAQTKRLSGAD